MTTDHGHGQASGILGASGMLKCGSAVGVRRFGVCGSGELGFDQSSIPHFSNLPFEHSGDQNDNTERNVVHSQSEDLAYSDDKHKIRASEPPDSNQELAEAFQLQGNKLAEEGKYKEALGKWEAALGLMPEKAILHEQKAQVLLEIGDAWNALKAATRATELEPSWAESWITLGRAQLDFGEPDTAIQSFDQALAIKPDSKEAQEDRKTASNLVKKRKQLHSSGLSTTENRYMVGEKTENT